MKCIKHTSIFAGFLVLALVSGVMTANKARA